MVLFELAYMRFYRVKAVCEERDGTFDEFRRIDLEQWSRLYFWPGAFLVFTTRGVIFFSTLLVMTIFDTFIMIGQPSTRPLSGWR